MIKSVKVNNSEMEYLSFGTGDKILVIIPGLSLKSVLLSEEAIIASFAIFVKDFTIYLFDRIKDIPDNYSIENMAEDTYNAMINLWIKSCNLYWASQWWMIAQCIAIQHQDFVEKMVLWSTTFKTKSNALRKFSERIELAKLNKISELNKNFLNNVYCKDTIKDFWEIILNSNADINDKEKGKFIKLSFSLLNFDIEEQVHNIKCKTLVIWSNNDGIFGKDSVIELANKLDCELYMYNNYGHAVYDEAPDFRKRMLDFLNN